MNHVSNLIKSFYITPISKTLPLTGRALEDARIIDIFNKFLEKVELNQKASFYYHNGAFKSYSVAFGVSDENGFTKKTAEEIHYCTDKSLNLCGISAYDRPIHKIDYEYSFHASKTPVITGSHTIDEVKERELYTPNTVHQTKLFTLRTQRDQMTEIPNISYHFNDKSSLARFPDYLDVDSLESTMQSLIKKKIAELEKTIKVSQ